MKKSISSRARIRLLALVSNPFTHYFLADAHVSSQQALTMVQIRNVAI